MPLRIGIVAGEASGDTLGAALIGAVRERIPDAQFMGVAGPKMQAAGCELWKSSEELAVMGVTEIVRHLPRLFRLRRELLDRFVTERPDVFVGIDAPEFNLGLEQRLKAARIPTVQYVSPQVWAWRQGRVRTMRESCDLVLCLLPFETQFYANHGTPAVFVGHPLADRIPLDVDREAARRDLHLDEQGTIVAILPGSRVGEVTRLGADFARAARWMTERRSGLTFVAPMASPAVRTIFADLWKRHAPQVPLALLDGRAQSALIASNVALVASGTATLETTLCKRPMVVAYRLGAITAFLLRTLGLVKVAHFSQPNLLAGRPLVREFFQGAVQGPVLGEALLAELDDPTRTAMLEREFRTIHEKLRVGGAGRAADAILELVRKAQIPGVLRGHGS